jgi:hypothetical protein
VGAVTSLGGRGGAAATTSSNAGGGVRNTSAASVAAEEDGVVVAPAAARSWDVKNLGRQSNELRGLTALASDGPLGAREVGTWIPRSEVAVGTGGRVEAEPALSRQTGTKP